MAWRSSRSTEGVGYFLRLHSIVGVLGHFVIIYNAYISLDKKPFAGADAKLTLTKSTLDRIQLKEITIEQAITSGELKVEGKREAFTEFVGMLDTFPFWFNIVTP